MVGETDRQGRFVSIEAMQTFQETIQEVARNHAVVGSTETILGKNAVRFCREITIGEKQQLNGLAQVFIA